MEVKPRIRKNVNASPQLHFLGGHFSLGPTSIPYVTTHMTISELAHYLKTPEQLPGWTDGPTEIEALYQRQLDYRRVKNRILPYLADSEGERPRFFNSITVALFPYKNHEIKSFDADECIPPSLEDTAADNIINTGPVTLGTYVPFDAAKPETFSVGELRWNVDQTATVAIDGQHRLAACQLLHNKNPEEAERTRVCVIFIIPSARLGYNGNSGKRNQLLTLLRSIFIDLNKHAKPVKRSRLILLDDSDPHSITVRRMLGTSLHDVDASSPKDGDRLPLALVDWHTDDAKFENGPYVTTVLMLDRIVQTLIGGVKPVTDWTDKKGIERQMEAFKRFGYTPSDECNKRYSDFRDAEELWQASFSYPQEDLGKIEDAIGTMCSPVVSSLLTRLKPYTELIELRRDYNMLSADFSNWYEAYCANDGTPEAYQRLQAVEDHLKHRGTPPKISTWKHCLEEEIPKLKNDNLFFKVVFQAALFNALQLLWRTPLPVIEDADIPKKGTPEHLLSWSNALESVINSLIQLDDNFFDINKTFSYEGRSGTFWAGSVLNLDRNAVDFTDSGMHRTAHWILLLTTLDYGRRRWLEVWQTGLPEDYKEFLERFAEEDPDYVQSFDQVAKKIRTGNSANRGSMWRLVCSLAEDPEQLEDQDWIEENAQKQLDARVGFIWSLLKKVSN